jgi:hypothetical protein
LVPSQVATEWAPLGHGEQPAPHVAGFMLLAHAEPQTWKSASHVKVQWPEVHAEAPLATAPQAVEHAPQLSRDVCRFTHWVPQSVGAVPPHPVAQANPAPAGAQSGSVEPQTALQLPQWPAWERSVSQPLAGFWSQSA